MSLASTYLFWFEFVPRAKQTFVENFFFYQRPYTECDPKKIIDLINNNFDISLPEEIISAKAAETGTSWLESNYMFILRFETDFESWKKFHASFPKIKDCDTKYRQLDGSTHINDVYGFWDYDPSKEEPRIEPWWGYPQWFKSTITKGKKYYKNMPFGCRLQIQTICVDLSDSDKVTIYIDGWGPYDNSYDLQWKVR